MAKRVMNPPTEEVEIAEEAPELCSEEPGAEPEVVEDDGLVEVTKGADSLRVHPTCLKDHIDAGWLK